MLSENKPLWLPRYTLTPAIARALMDIEAARAVVEQTPLPPAAEAQLRHRARIRSTHYSTSIEGNRLTLAEAEQVTTSQVAATLGLSERMTRMLLNTWVKDGWLVVSNPSNRKRTYGLSEIYRQYIDSLSAIHEDEK